MADKQRPSVTLLPSICRVPECPRFPYYDIDGSGYCKSHGDAELTARQRLSTEPS